MVGGKMKARETEIARREEVVRLGKLQLQMMERRRQLEQTERRIEERLRRSLELERLLGDLEREKEAEQEDAGSEIVRRKAVMKLWRLQVKVMERRRGLERMLGEVRQLHVREEEREKLVEDAELKMARAGEQLETRGVGEGPTQISIFQFIYPGLADKLAQAVQPLASQLEELKERMEKMLKSLEEVETLQQQDQEQAEALR